MKIGRVMGNVVATVKDPALNGKTLLLVQPVDSRRRPSGPALIALDSVGAGVGEDVYYVRGKEASFPWYPNEIPCDCAIVGILDPSNFEQAESPSPRGGGEDEASAAKTK